MLFGTLPILSLLLLAGPINDGLAVDEPSVAIEAAAATSMEEEYSCTVTVYKRSSSGQTWAYEYATVSAQLTNGLFTSNFTTDSRGRAKIVWHVNKDLKTIFVKGVSKGYDGRYEDGGSYTIYVDV